MLGISVGLGVGVTHGGPGASGGGGGPILLATFAGDGVIGNADTGQAFTNHAGTWARVAGQAVATPAGYSTVSADTGVSDATWSVDLTHALREHYLLFRGVDASNYLLLGFNAESLDIKLYQVVATVFTQLSTDTLAARTGNARVVSLADSLSLWFAGVPVRVVTSSTHQTGTRAGMLASQDGSADNLTVTV